MTKTKALKEAEKRWGKAAGVRETRQATSPEKRSAARCALLELRGLLSEPQNKGKLLGALSAFRNELTSQALAHRFSVGSLGNAGGYGFFSVKGYGDSWEEAFAHADKGNG